MEQRLAEIGQNFAERRDFHYRQQLQSYQADMNYIQMANLYDNKPLDVYGHDIIDEGTASTAASVNGSLRSTQQAPMNGNSRLERPLKIGSYASRFQKEIGDAMEQRDADLTTLAVSTHTNLPTPSDRLRVA